jgi:ligand-binding sensor domain-containing protein/signal transduction histidine kinase
MSQHLSATRGHGWPQRTVWKSPLGAQHWTGNLKGAAWTLMLFLAVWWGAPAVRAGILWNDLGATSARETGAAGDVLGGVLKRDASSTDTLYFKFHVDPLSDASTEEYFAAFELYEGEAERLALGNALKAWAYSAFNASEKSQSNNPSGYIDLRSARPEPSGVGTYFAYELPHRGLEVTIVFKVQYVAGGDDLVTAWLNPDLGPGATEAEQSTNLTTTFHANASFNQIRLRHGGGGEGWTFSEMAIATAFNDFVVDASGAKTGGTGLEIGRGEMPFIFRSWQREQGLPQNFVRALAQTREGYIWVGSDDGVTRFDGVRFVSFGSPEGLRSGPVQALLGDSRGALWIGGAGNGLSRFLHGQFTAFTTRDGLPSDTITVLAEDNSGRIWAGTEAGLAVKQGGRFEPLKRTEEINHKRITALCQDRTGTMWLGVAGAGVFCFKGGRLIPLRDASVDELLRDPHCLLVDRGGRIWVGAGDDFVLCCDGGQWRRHRILRHLARHYVSALAEEADGTVWAGSLSEGLFQFRGGKLDAINAGSGLSDNLVESLLVDQEGKLWVGTHGGLNRLQPANLAVLSHNEGLGYGAVQGLAEVAPGLIWAGKPSDGLYRWSGGNFSPLPVAGMSSRDLRINALLLARDGTCWMAGAKGLLRSSNPQSAQLDAEPPALTNLCVLSLGQDAQGCVWAGTREGELWRLTDGQWRALTNYAPGHPITALVADTDGSMWIGTEGNGLDRYQGTVVTHWDKGAGLLSDLIRTLYLDPEGALWIGTAGGGLSRLRNGRLATFTTREGLPDNTISQILEDDAGSLWLGGNGGVVRVSKRDLDDLAAGRIPAVYPQVYGRAEGMLSEECTGGFFPAGLKTKSGLLWFSTLKGIVVADPHRHAVDVAVPGVVLEEALVDGVPQPQFGAADSAPVPLRIPPGWHRIEFHYTGLSFDAPERVRFRYRLEGLDANWVEAGSRRMAFYNYVPPGAYRFRVIACNADGVWNETGASLPLVVLPHFWQTWWAIGLAAAGLLVCGGRLVGAVEMRKHQRRLRQLEQERALERERTRIAQDLHDEMGAKLCRISFLSEDARRGDQSSAELHDQICSISDASREVLHSLDEIVWAVNPQNDTLDQLASYIGQYVEEYFQMTGIKCEVDLPARPPRHPLSSQRRHHLFLALREAFTNMLKHSVASRSKISMTCSGSTLEIVISDNGSGFDPPAIEAGADGQTAASGNGLRNMRQRMADIGGHCAVESAPGCGTTIRFLLPLDKLSPKELIP